MPDLSPKLQPPQRYGDLTELEQIFSQTVPGMMFEMASLFGKRTPRLTRLESAKIRKKLRRFLVAARPYLLGLYALRGVEDRDRCVYALMEGLCKEQLKAGGKKVPEGKDAFEFLLKLVAAPTASPKTRWANSPPYSFVKQKLYEFCVHLFASLNPLLVEQLMQSWACSKDARKAVQFNIGWPTLIRQSRNAPPKRLTIVLATQLANEYRTCASFLENRLRLLVFLDQTTQGITKTWSDWERTNLAQLLQTAGARHTLDWVPPLIDRNVRNALAHGQPEINLDLRECRFHDRSVTVSWKFDEFFRKTKQLTLTNRALLEFESILSHVQTHAFVGDLWKRFGNS